jgi:hypothetical protein
MQVCLGTTKCTAALNRLAWAGVCAVAAQDAAEAPERSSKSNDCQTVSFGNVVLFKYSLEQGSKAKQEALARAMLASCKNPQASVTFFYGMETWQY